MRAKTSVGVILEIRSGPGAAGKSISLRRGESVTVGRAAAKSTFVLAEDTFLSGLHFSAECSAQGCTVTDRKSSNGTFLNGRKLREFEPTPLANGDELKAGQTIFAVKIVADEKLQASTIPSKVSSAAPEAPPAKPKVPESPRAAEPPQRDVPAPQRGEEPKPAPPARKVPTQPPPSDHLSGGDASGFFASPQPKPERDAAKDAVPREPRRSAPAESERPRKPERPAERLGEAQRYEPPPREVVPPPEPPRFRTVPPPPVPGGVPKSEPVGAKPPAAPRRDDEFAERALQRSGAGGRAVAFRVMGWSFPAAPANWQVQEGFGLQQKGAEDSFPGSVAATEEPLGGITLQQFVESQISTLRGYLRNARIEPQVPPNIGGADESMAVDVRHATKDGKELVYRRIYARSGASVGVLTVTTMDAQLTEVLSSLQGLLEGAAFHGGTE